MMLVNLSLKVHDAGKVAIPRQLPRAPVVLASVMLALITFPVFIGCGTVASSTSAEETFTLGNLRAKKAQQLSRGELESLMPEANVLSIAGTGSVRRWKNNKDGKLVASSNNAGYISPSISLTGDGSWWVAYEGRYCVEIIWPGPLERWCRVIYRLGDIYYGVAPSAYHDTARAYRFEFTR